MVCTPIINEVVSPESSRILSPMATKSPEGVFPSVQRAVCSGQTPGCRHINWQQCYFQLGELPKYAKDEHVHALLQKATNQVHMSHRVFCITFNYS